MIDINNLGIPRQRAEQPQTEPPPPIIDKPPRERKLFVPNNNKPLSPPPRPPPIYTDKDERIRRLTNKIIMLEGGLFVAFIFIAFLLGIWFGVVL